MNYFIYPRIDVVSADVSSYGSSIGHLTNMVIRIFLKTGLEDKFDERRVNLDTIFHAAETCADKHKNLHLTLDKIEQMFDNLIKGLSCLAVLKRGSAMDYKEQILEIIRRIDDEKMLRYIYTFISSLLNGKKSNQ